MTPNQQDNNQPLNCATCGEKLNNGAKFCGNCGNKKADNVSAVTSTKTSVKRSHWNIVVGIVIFFFLSGLTRSIISNLSSNTDDKASLITKSVQDAKSSQAFPTELDDVTTWTDITAESNAVRYHYALHDVDLSSISSDSLKDYLRPQVCQNKDTKSILDKDIGMEFSYSVVSSADTYFVSIIKSDCN